MKLHVAGLFSLVKCTLKPFRMVCGPLTPSPHKPVLKNMNMQAALFSITLQVSNVNLPVDRCTSQVGC